jgi:D-sedoheptulose 7-phosphate isomerase
MIAKKFATDYLADLGRLLPQLDTQKITQAAQWLDEAARQDKTIYACGNGGSASIASQMVVDMVKGASTGRTPRFKMIGLIDSVATITAYGNDISYESVFVEPLRNFARPGDVLIAISGSGNSPNILRAVEFANSAGVRTIGLTTAQGGRLKDLAQLPLLVPSGHMGRLEDSFFIITHILCYTFMAKVL